LRANIHEKFAPRRHGENPLGTIKEKKPLRAKVHESSLGGDMAHACYR
jgi:hypothetical protein